MKYTFVQIRTNSEVVRWWWCSGDSGMRVQSFLNIFSNLKSILSFLVRCRTSYGKRVRMGYIAIRIKSILLQNPSFPMFSDILDINILLRK